MIKYILLLLLPLLFSGCGEENVVWGDVPFIEMEQEEIVIQEHIDLCKIKPDSIFCTNSPSTGDIKPTKAYVMHVLQTMNSNFTYTRNDVWIYNDNIYQHLKGDCEDISSTMGKHMEEEGIDKKYMSLVYRMTSETTAHMFLAIETSDAGILHVDYANSGYPIEPQINFHMKLNKVGVYSWVKGNIEINTEE